MWRGDFSLPAHFAPSLWVKAVRGAGDVVGPRIAVCSRTEWKVEAIAKRTRCGWGPLGALHRVGECVLSRATQRTVRAPVRTNAPPSRPSGARGACRPPRAGFYDLCVGQTPAQKAAKAARGQQPKKRPGKAQREAIKRAQAAKKTAGGGKPPAKKAAAKKTVPLPRGSLRAAYGGTCPSCFKDYAKGEVITKVADGWGHPGCAPRPLSAAEREFARNKARIESGDTFRGQKPSDWRRGASPSSSRPAR